MTDRSPAVMSEGALLALLDERGLLTSADDARACLSERADRQQLPGYVHAVAGIGAVIGASCFIGFLFALGILDVDAPNSMLVWGVAFLIGGLALNRLGDARTTLTQSFAIQSAFLLAVSGKILLAAGAAWGLESGWGIPLGILGATVLTYRLLAIDAERFLALYAGFGSILVNILWLADWDNDVRSAAGHTLFVAVLVAAAWLATRGDAGHAARPARNAAFAMVLTIAAASSIGTMSSVGFEIPIGSRLVPNAALAIAFVALVAWIRNDFIGRSLEHVLAASVIACGLMIVGTPGVMASIALLILGQALRERTLTAVAGTGLALFLGLYYYSLEISLADKALALVASGLVLLAARRFVRAKLCPPRGQT